VEDLHHWCEAQMKCALHLEPMTGDASFRRYFRIREPLKRVAMYAPPAREKVREFLAVGKLLCKAGVTVPAVHGADTQRGFFLLEDFGDDLLLGCLDSENADALYDLALETLLCIQEAPREANGFQLPERDAVTMAEELALFPEWFVRRLLGIELREEDTALVHHCAELLIAAALEQPTLPVHGDFHSRNLLLLPQSRLGVLDFQDAFWGGITYDLASLFKDCYIAWPRSQVEGWIERYLQKSAARGRPVPASREVFLRWFDRMGLQRHLKVLGIFSRLYLRDGKPAYLGDLPQVITYVREGVAAAPELAFFGDWFESRLAPAIARRLAEGTGEGAA